MLDSIAVCVIVAAAAAYLIYRQTTKKPSEGCGSCPGGCSGHHGKKHNIQSRPHECCCDK